MRVCVSIKSTFACAVTLVLLSLRLFNNSNITMYFDIFTSRLYYERNNNNVQRNVCTPSIQTCFYVGLCADGCYTKC